MPVADAAQDSHPVNLNASGAGHPEGKPVFMLEFAASADATVLKKPDNTPHPLTG